MIWNMSEDDFDAVVSVHLKGHWNMAHHAVKYMRQAGFGRIVNFSSDAFKGSVGQCNYSASKAGIIGLTRAVAKETSKFGITVNAICPSADTRMTVNDAVKANRKQRGRIHTYYFGEEYRSLHKGDDGMFTVDDLIETIPGLMSGIVPVVPPVKMSEAVKSGDMKRAG